MNSISKSVEVNISTEKAFVYFIEELVNWWPREYTWSQDALVDMKIDARVNGLCSEIGPNDFRCDWGTVTAIEHQTLVAFTWQISLNRAPIPNPQKASNVKIRFHSISGIKTHVTLEHTNFKNHGKEHERYLQAMDSGEGWSFILKRFKHYCET